MKEDRRATGGGKRVTISRARKRAVAIVISCLGIAVEGSYLIDEFLKAGSLTDFLQRFTQPSMILHHIMMLLSIPAFMLVGYFYLKLQDLADNLEQIVEERTERLRESQTRLKNIFAASPDAITVSDLNGNIIECNQATLDMGGFSSKEELIGKSALELIAKKDHQTAMENLKKTLEQSSVRNIEYTFLTKDRREFPAELSASVIRDASGNPTGFVAITKDITERKKAEEKLRFLKEFNEKIVESLSDALLVIDPNDYTIIRANEAALKQLKLRKEKLIGKTCYETTHYSPTPCEPPHHICPIQEMLKTGKAFTVEHTHFDRDNNEIYVEVSACPVRNREGKIVQAVHLARDVTKRKKMEEKLKEYSEHLEELVEERTRELKESQERLIKSERLAAIGELATMVGHDLRNPLQSIENAAYYLNNELSRLPPSIPISQKTVEMLHIINDSVNYADKIIRDLQDFSATKKPNLTKTDVNAIVMEALSQIEAPKNVELITELDHHPEIKVDKDMLKRVFLNLAVNGIQAMENGGRLTVTTKKTKGFVEVSFKDTGIGMSKENIEKIFSPFFTTKAKGMGMGLAICKRFVDAHDGGIEVESEEGKGSTFTVKLPIQPRQMEVKTIVEG